MVRKNKNKRWTETSRRFQNRNGRTQCVLVCIEGVKRMNESEVQQRIQIEGPKHRCILLRNNSGACVDRDGRLIRYGLGNISKKHNDQMKSSDLIGITTRVVTQDMVGKTIGIFTAIECKNDQWKPKEDKRTSAQRNFINWVKQMGGIAGFATSTDEFVHVLKS